MREKSRSKSAKMRDPVLTPVVTQNGLSESCLGYQKQPKAISESCLGYQKQLFRIWEQEFTSDFISYPKPFCRYERDIRN